MTRVLVRGGTILDGASPQGRQAELLVENGLIVEVASQIPRREATSTVDVDGMWVMPGFIDPHSHADAAVLTGEQMNLRALSGVTTEIVGQDGLGLAHAQGNAADQMLEILTPIAGCVDGLLASDVRDYLARVDEGAFARVATLSPHGTIRSAVVGRALRAVTDQELREMTQLFVQDLKDGAVGLSTGLSYPPAFASNASELTALLSAPDRKTIHVTHLRSYGSQFDDAIDEVLDVAQASGSHLHMSHFHVSGTGREGRAQEYLTLIHDALPSTTFDSYPYVHACTFLSALLPPELNELPWAALTARINQNFHAIRDQIDRSGPEQTISTGWASLVLAGMSQAHADWNGRAIAETASAHSVSPGHIVLQALLTEDKSPMVLVPQGHSDNIVTIANSVNQVVGSDGIFGSGAPHPRISSSFFRFLHMASSGALSLSPGQAVAKMTSRTADIFGLPLGRLLPGYPADLLVVDPDFLEPGPDVTVEAPRALIHSMIAGSWVVRDGSWRGDHFPGMAVRAA